MTDRGGAGLAAKAGPARAAARPPVNPIGPSPLIGAKTARPTMRHAGVPRGRLFDRLDAAAGAPVTVVCAGAGWGKTMLVSAWAQTRREPVAWLSLDRHDNDPQLFWAYVVAALRVAGVLSPDNPLAQIGSVPADGPERARLIAAGLSRLAQPTILVIDDLQEIDDAQTLRETGDLIRHLPAPIRAVLITRTEPELSLHRLRTAGQVAEIRAEHLAFTADEAAALVSDHGLPLAAEDVTSLLDRTEGWAAGLRLAADFLTGRDGHRSISDFSGDVRGVDEYLTHEVVAGRSRRLRRFLLQTSICDQVCADLANAITARSDAQRTLERLERDNDFVVRLGAKPLWFRYHQMLRSVLGHRLALETPTMVPELHRRAARWYAANNSVMEALTHAISARDWSYVGHVVTSQAAPLILSTHRAALARILGTVPPEQLTSTPELMICAAVLLVHAGDYDAIPARLQRAREQLQRRPDDAARRPVEAMLLALQLAADRALGDMPAIISGSTDLLTLLARETSAEGAVIVQQRAVALNNRGLANLWSGRPDPAAADLWAAAAAARTAGVELTEINAVGHLALLHVMHGSVQEAAQLARSARDLAELRGWRNALQTVAAHLADALVHLDRNDLDAAQQALDQGLRAHRSDPEAAQRLVLLGVQARLAVAHGEQMKARLFLDDARHHRNPRFQAPALDRWLSLIEAEVDLAAGVPDRVEQRLTEIAPDLPQRVLRARAAVAARDLARAQLLLEADPAAWPHTVASVEAGVLGALVADERGQAIQAVDLLADAVNLAVREGIRRPFVTLSSRRLDDLLYRLPAVKPAAAPSVQKIISDVRTRTSPAATAAVQGLSERETEVLRYLPTMLTAAEIAARFGVSINTIKAHMRSIYRKLGVGKRSEAVTKARASGIL